MSYLEGHCRPPRLLLSELLEDSVTEEHPVRFLEAEVARLDLVRRGCMRAQAAVTGRPAYDPRAVRKRYLYGYRTRISSRRRLAREPPRHVELIGLLRQLRADFKTMADFRKKNTTALPALCRAVVLLGRQWDLFGAVCLALAGSQFKAGNNPHQTFTQAQRAKALKDIAEQVAQEVRALDAADSEEASVHQPTNAALQQKMERLPERQQRSRGGVEDMCWVPSAREGSYKTLAPHREQLDVRSVAHTETSHLNTRDLIPWHRRSQCVFTQSGAWLDGTHC